MKQKILVALSGGVDSAVSAYLLKKAGHCVEGVYMRTWMNENNDFITDCPWEKDRESAKSVAEHLQIPFRLINMIEDYQKEVVSYLITGYQNGLTPNPDTLCNRAIKFGILLDYAKKEGFDQLATGHYCQIKCSSNGEYKLYEGADPLKDQSYFLALIKKNNLPAISFPIGHLTKPEVRHIASEAQLPNATRKDSQGICFLGNVPIQQFLKHYIPDNPGPIINLEGKHLGTHQGLHRYTLGQRKGIGIPSNTDYENYVVIKKDLANNALIVAFDKFNTPGLYTTHAHITQINWLINPIQQPTHLLARPRYRDPAESAQFLPENLESGTIIFKNSQRALAPGQIMALYQENQLLGGGILDSCL